jgi:hypothetical protein
MPDAFAWLSDARALLQERDNGLLAAGPPAGRGGFVGGAEWMRQAMSTVRGRPDDPAVDPLLASGRT